MGLKLFKDVLAYRLTQPVELFDHDHREALNDELSRQPSRQPGSQELETFGFIEPAGEEKRFVEDLNDDAMLISAQIWKRDLPASVVTRELNLIVSKIERDEERKVYSKEKRQLKDDIILKLLPRAFVKGKRVSAIIKDGLVYIDTSSAKLAEQMLSLLRSSLGSLPVRPVTVRINPIVSMTDWLRRSAVADSEDFLLGESFHLRGATVEASTLSGKDVDLSDDDIRDLLASGRQVTQLGLSFVDTRAGETVPFTLTEDLTLKGIQWPDCLLDQAQADVGEDAAPITTFRATMFLLADSLGSLFDALLHALGGEDHGAETTADFEKRMEKATAAATKHMTGFKLGDSNLATDFPVQETPNADDEDDLI
jgi:recombination associated protein RdgC